MTFLLLAINLGLAQAPVEPVDVEKDPTRWEFREGTNPVTLKPEPMAIAQSIRRVVDLAEKERHGFLSIQCSDEGPVVAVAVPGIVRARQGTDLKRLVKSTKAKVQIANDVWDLRVFPFETLDGWAVTAEESRVLIDALYARPDAVVTTKTPMRKGENVVQFQPRSMVELGQLRCLKAEEQ